MRYSGIIFDMGDIFFDATQWRRWLTEHLRGLGVAIDYEALCDQWEQHLVPVYRGEKDYWEAFSQFLESIHLSDTQQAGVIEAARQMARSVEKRTLFDGVKDTLERLKQSGVRLAVLSDTESPESRVRQRLVVLDIEQYFDAVVTSVDIGFTKPQKGAYDEALTRLGISPQQTVFVGHDQDELEGAMSVGLTAVAFNYSSTVPAHYHLRSFTEIIGIAVGSDH